MPLDPTQDPGLHEGLGGVDPDLLGGKLGTDLRTARDFANAHPIPSDGKVLEDVTLTGGGTVDVVQHDLGRDPTGVQILRSDTITEVPQIVSGSSLSSPKPDGSHCGVAVTTAATVDLLVF